MSEDKRLYMFTIGADVLLTLMLITLMINFQKDINR